MKYQLYEIAQLNINNSQFEVLKKIEVIEWNDFSAGANSREHIEDDSGTIYGQFDSVEKMEEDLKKLFEREKKNNYFEVNISSYSKFTYLPILKTE